MTYAYDLERLRVALADATKAAGELFAHNIPDWLRHRLTTHMGECISLDLALAEHQQEKGAAECTDSE